MKERLDPDADAVIARYPVARSALLPLLHLVQAEEGHVSGDGIKYCAEKLDLTTAEVSGVATFYSMYKRRQVGDFHVGVCTNTLCAVLGGDEIFATLKEHLGVENDQRTAVSPADRSLTLEHIECNAACDLAPVVMVNWEFFDNMTPQSATELVDDLRSGAEVHSTRGPWWPAGDRRSARRFPRRPRRRRSRRWTGLAGRVRGPSGEDAVHRPAARPGVAALHQSRLRLDAGQGSRSHEAAARPTPESLVGQAEDRRRPRRRVRRASVTLKLAHPVLTDNWDQDRDSWTLDGVPAARRLHRAAARRWRCDPGRRHHRGQGLRPAR